MEALLDFTLLENNQTTLAEMAAGISPPELHRLLDDLYDHIENQIKDITNAEVVFVPSDPEADDPYAADPADVKLAWTLGHVIVHLTASAEEATAQATNLARGVEICGRSRYETPWRTVTTAAQVHKRLAESRRMQHALLDAWPDDPNLVLTFTPGYPGAQPRNAIGYFIVGLYHSDSHLEQIDKILAQALANK